MWRTYTCKHNEFNAAYNRLCPIIPKVFNVVKNNTPYSDIHYVNVLPRHWWHSLSRRLAWQIDFYINRHLRRHFRIKEIWPYEVMFDHNDHSREQVLHSMVCTDEVHLNNYGNCTLTMAMIRPIIPKWLNHLRERQVKLVPTKCKYRKFMRKQKRSADKGTSIKDHK